MFMAAIRMQADVAFYSSTQSNLTWNVRYIENCCDISLKHSYALIQFFQSHFHFQIWALPDGTERISVVMPH